ncbi:hypothetical protein GW17_00026077 [Ensete ventricosum]|nr:hypothetical protein GW17_00026077 [Ensete ventricosum]
MTAANLLLPLVSLGSVDRCDTELSLSLSPGGVYHRSSDVSAGSSSRYQLPVRSRSLCFRARRSGAMFILVFAGARGRRQQRSSRSPYSTTARCASATSRRLRGVVLHAGEGDHKRGRARDGGEEAERSKTRLLLPPSSTCTGAAAGAEPKPVDEAVAADVSAEQEDEGGRLLLPPLRRCSNLDFVASKKRFGNPRFVAEFLVSEIRDRFDLCMCIRRIGFYVSDGVGLSVKITVVVFHTGSRKTKVLVIGSFRPLDVKTRRRFEIVCHAMLAPRKFMQRRKKVEVFKDAADEAEQKNWRKLMKEIEELGSAVPILKTQRAKMDALPRDLVLGTLVRFKQLKKWGLVGEVLMQRAGVKPDVVSYALLISAYGKARREQEALAVFEEMLDAGVR